MTEKVYVVTDLGPGDGGKGGVVHKIASMMRVHTVLKRGGAQGSHGVHTARGESFNFSQWGCGTFEGIPTHLTSQMVVAPEGLLNEAAALRYEAGVQDPFSLLTADENAVCATPFHGIASRIKELVLGDQSRGTVGTGVGQSYRSFRKDPDAAILVRDLRSSALRDKLVASQRAVQDELQYIIEYDFQPEDRATLAEEVGLLYSSEFLDYCVERFAEVGRLLQVVSSGYLGEVVLRRKGSAIVETSHGVLTDRERGFHPHTSALRTLPEFTKSMLQGAGFDGSIVNIGVSRAYAIRHGAGPLPTVDPVMSEVLLPGSSKQENRYQGKVRVGPLDTVLLRYAIEVCGGAEAFDGLAISWFDQILRIGFWEVCDSYEGVPKGKFFTSSGDIQVPPQTSIEHQRELTKLLYDARPRIRRIPVDPAPNADELYITCARTVEEKLQVPVRMVSFGPTETNKICR